MKLICALSVLLAVSMANYYNDEEIDFEVINETFEHRDLAATADKTKVVSFKPVSISLLIFIKETGVVYLFYYIVYELIGTH